MEVTRKSSHPPFLKAPSGLFLRIDININVQNKDTHLIWEAYLQEGKITNYFANIGKALFGKTRDKMTIGEAEQEKLAEILARGGDAAVHQFLETLEEEGGRQFEDFVPSAVKTLVSHLRQGADTAVGGLFVFLKDLGNIFVDVGEDWRKEQIRNRVDIRTEPGLDSDKPIRAADIDVEIRKLVKQIKVLKKTAKVFPEIGIEIIDLYGKIKDLEMEFLDIAGFTPKYDRSIWRAAV